MPLSEARKRANKKWNDENLAVRYDHIHLTLPAGYKERIKASAERQGYSVNELIRYAIDDRLELTGDK